MDKIKKIKREYIITIFIIIAVLPVFIIGIYAHPSADDYGYSSRTYNVLLNGGNIIDLIVTAFETTMYYMKSWQGLYSSAFLLSLQPAIFGESFYFLTPCFIAGMLFLGLTFLLKKVFKYIFKSESRKYWFVSLVFWYYIIETMPSPLEGLYWFNGGVNYLVFLAFLFIQLGTLIKYYFEPKNYIIIFSILWAFIISGGNHITAFACILINFFFCIFTFVKKKKRLTVLSFISGVTGFVINMTANGTSVRSRAINYQGSVIETIAKTGIKSIININSWCTLSLIFLLIIIIATIYRELENLKLNKNNLIIMGLLSYIVFAGMMAVPYYAMGNFGASRVKDTLYIFFDFIFILNVCLIYSYCSKYFECLNVNALLKKDYLMTIIVCIGIVFITFAGNDYTTSVEATFELSNGIAKRYSKQVNIRIYQIQNGGDDVVIDKIIAKPTLIYLGDITEDADDWTNNAMEAYYNKNSIVIPSEEE